LEQAALQDIKREGGTDEEVKAAISRVREIYERSVAHVPPGDEKKHWRRYIFLWLNYALFEEIDVKVRFCYNFGDDPFLLASAFRIMNERDRSIRLHSSWSLTSDLHSLNCGLCSQNSKFAALT
jgi:hypothetical protein